MELLNSIIEFIVFLTALYSLLAVSKQCYKPIVSSRFDVGKSFLNIHFKELLSQLEPGTADPITKAFEQAVRYVQNKYFTKYNI
jgi:hypothetical protein